MDGIQGCVEGLHKFNPSIEEMEVFKIYDDEINIKYKYNIFI